MKRIFIFSFIVLGISSIIGQIVVIRELMISFYGNEFFIGWVLFAWLFWVGIGSLVLGKLFKKIENIFKGLISCHILVALFLPLEIYLIRLSKYIIGTPPGEIPNLIPALLYAFLIIAPLCLILGFQFVMANKAWKSLSKKSELSHLLGKSYFYETVGFIVGGLIFSYILIFVNEFKVSGILAWLNIFAAGFLVFVIKNKLTILKIIAVVLLIVFAGIFVWAKDINLETSKLRFPNQELIESKNSLYGNIAVTKIGAQYNFYESGLLLGADKEEIFNEYLVHFPLLYNPNPKNILLIGAGFNGALGEILKHQPSQVYYLELDPELIKTAERYTSLKNERVKLINIDARYFLKNSQEKFDVIIINLPSPSTALINRFYTQEFLKEAQSHLNPQGILAIHLSSSPNYLNPELENLQASLFKTIKKTFPYLVILPEDTNFFIASQDNLNYDPEFLIQGLNQRNIKNNFVTKNYIEYRLTNDRVQTVLNILEQNKTAKINQDQHPISYYYNFTYWISYFHSGLAKFLSGLSKINFVWIVGLFVLSVILLGFWILSPSGLRARAGMVSRLKSGRARAKSLSEPRWGSREKRGDRYPKPFFLPLAMAIAGFSLMATEIIIIYAFQVFYGYLYYKIGLIITALMVGMAIGTWLGTKRISGAKTKSLILIHSAIIIFCLIFLLGSWFLFKTSPNPSLIMEMVFLSFAALIGAIVGFEFPIVNKLYLTQIKNPGKKTGTIYGADLLGSCLGASLVSIFLVPIFGVFQTLLILIVINLLILIFLFLAKKV